MRSFTFSLTVLIGLSMACAPAIAKDKPSILKNTSFTGATYKTSTLIKPDVQLCRKACNADKQCKAWTYRARGARMVGYKPQCYLKNKVPAKISRSGYTSGIKNIAMGMTIKNTQILSQSMIAVSPVKKKKENTAKAPPVSTQIPTLNSNISLPGLNTRSVLNTAAFDKVKTRRNKAVREALAKAKKQKEQREAARREMRRRASANTGSPRSQTHPFRALKLDCDDNDPSVHPDQNEVCNLKDDNCDGHVDEGVLLTVYRDADGDSFGDPENMTKVCASGDGLVGMSLNALDCDDTDVRRNPAAGTCN